MSDTRQAIMNHGEYLVRTKGANGFSYADLANKLGIRKASIHYYFPSKNDLLDSLLESYHERHMHALEEFAQLVSAREKLLAFVNIYRQGLLIGALCLCGMFTLDSSSLTLQMRKKLDSFFQDTEIWLANVFREGHSQNQWQLVDTPELEAKAFLALVQGAQIISRNASKEVEKFDTIVQQQLDRYM